MKYKITLGMTVSPYELVMIKFGKQKTIDDIQDMCIRNMVKNKIDKGCILIQVNDKSKTSNAAYFSNETPVQYLTYGRLEDLNEIVIIPVEKIDDKIVFKNTEFIVEV